MPQLNPEPWLLILCTSWLTLITILQPKIKSHLTTNMTQSKNYKTNLTSPWTWPWTTPSSINSHHQK
uniref:ATP synthase complex subunit 8 n=1 Tax=Peltocephalus dumerilianus TaxID=329145 RepID=A0A1Z4EAU5_9SAUR|nr:ATPase subunit 8 [Peltocephalus dumerilianus]